MVTAPRRQVEAGNHGLGARGLGPRGRGLLGRLLQGLRPNVASRREGVSIAVGSGKGGTGKSFLATSLAVLSHRAGVRTGIVDCDFGLACDHLLLGVKPTMTLQQLLHGQATLDQTVCTTPCGPRLLPGASGVRRMAAMSDKDLVAFAHELGEMAAREEILVLDLGAGISPATILTMLCADWIVLVTQPEIAALVDAYAVIKCVAQLDDNARFLIVVNRVPVPGRGELAFNKLTDVARQHVGVRLEYLGEILDDPSVTQHRLGQLPLVAIEPEAPLTRGLAAMQRRLGEICGGFEQREVEADAGIEARFKRHRLFL
ncbi:MAG: P-loop NTPase [Planctomycetes bacterium]|nr:P-loop NTPase [Planctomycetota bacterium]